MKWVINLFIVVSIISILACVGNNLINNADGKMVNIHVKDKKTNEPMVGVEVQVFKIKKPLFTIWQFHQIAKVDTDENGNCAFKVNKKGQYSLSIYRKNKLLFSTDEIVIDNLENQEDYTITF